MTLAASFGSRHAGDTDRDAPRRGVAPWLVLLVICLGQFMVLLDVSVVNVALPSIRSDLGFSEASLQWVVTAYTLTFAGFLLLGGRAGDLFGRRRLFLIGLALFALASLVGGLATTQTELVAARAFQGLGAAVLSPATLSLLLAIYPEGVARARALGVWSASAAAGGASGALLGGVITQLLSWRWILFVNVPIGVLVFAGARLMLPESRGNTALRRHLDVLGALTVTGGLVAVVWGIARSQALGWGDREVVGAFLLGAVLLSLFIAVEATVSRAPLVPLRLFRSRSVTTANLVSLAVTGALFPMWFFESLYLQGVRGDSPLRAGLTFIPQTLMIIVGAQISARLIPRIGARPLLVAGPLLIAAGLAWLAQISVGGDLITSVLIPGSVATLGGGLSFTAVAIAATTGVSRAEAGLASGMVNTTRQVGGSLGLAALSTVAAAHSAGITGVGGPAALTLGFGLALGAAAGVGVLGSLIGLTVPGRVRVREAGRCVEANSPRVAEAA